MISRSVWPTIDFPHSQPTNPLTIPYQTTSHAALSLTHIERHPRRPLQSAWIYLPRRKAFGISHYFPLAPSPSPMLERHFLPDEFADPAPNHTFFPRPICVKPEYCSWSACTMACRTNPYYYLASYTSPPLPYYRAVSLYLYQSLSKAATPDPF